MKASWILAAATCMVLGLSTSAGAGKNDASSPWSKLKEGQCTMAFKVSNMACPTNCKPKVARALKSVTGVADVSIQFDKSLANVLANQEACNKKSRKAMIRAVKDAGYKCKAVKTKTGKKPSKPTQES